jgi:hypothetical protein
MLLLNPIRLCKRKEEDGGWMLVFKARKWKGLWLQSCERAQ